MRSGLAAATLNTRRPMRPKPLIAMRIAMDKYNRISEKKQVQNYKFRMPRKTPWKNIMKLSFWHEFPVILP
jgi:hypothetical protein